MEFSSLAVSVLATTGLFLCPIFLSVGIILLIRKRLRSHRVSPLTADLLRPAGHTLQQQIQDLQFGKGEWKDRKHGAEKRRVWRKLHLEVDLMIQDIVAVEVPLENVHDTEVLPTSFNPLRRMLGVAFGWHL
jgi:hypothetical protein